MKQILIVVILIVLGCSDIYSQSKSEKPKGDIMSPGFAGVTLGKAVSLPKPPRPKEIVVTVTILVDQKGDVFQATGDGPEQFLEEALRAARASKFSPTYEVSYGDTEVKNEKGNVVALAFGTRNGRALITQRTLKYTFFNEKSVIVEEGEVLVLDYKLRMKP